MAVHPDTAEAVDSSLRGQQPETEIRWLENGEVALKNRNSETRQGRYLRALRRKTKEAPRMYLFGINRQRLEEEARSMGLEIEITEDLRTAGLMVTSKSYFHRKPQKIRDAEARGVPIYVLRTHTPMQLRHMLATMHPQAAALREDNPSVDRQEALATALREAEKAASEVKHNGEEPVELSPQGAYIRRLQHLIAERNKLSSKSVGREPNRHVMIYREGK